MRNHIPVHCTNMKSAFQYEIFVVLNQCSRVECLYISNKFAKVSVVVYHKIRRIVSA